MKCNNFFCESYDKTQDMNCDYSVVSYDIAIDCPQRKAFNRFNKPVPNGFGVIDDWRRRFTKIKKELEN